MNIDPLFNLRNEFLLDFTMFVIPIILFVTIFGENVLVFYVLMLSLILFACILILSNKSNTLLNSNEKEIFNEVGSQRLLGNKIIKLSINTYRASVFVITSVVIIAVDFNIFSQIHAKTSEFGISLMDLGVGLFIFCHSMRVIRNSNDKEIVKHIPFKKYLNSK